MKLRQISGLGVALFGIPGLQAATVEQTAHFNESATYTNVSSAVQLIDTAFFSGTFDPFDNSLGTLTGFVIEWSLESTATGNIGPAGGMVTLQLLGPLTINGSTYQFITPILESFGGAPNSPIALSVPFVQTHTFLVSGAGDDYDSAYLDAVMGDAHLTISFGSAVDYSVSGSATFDAATLGTVTLRYNYTAVPEPATFTAFAGVAMLGVAAWHRRRRVA